MFSAKQGHYWYHFYNVFGMTRLVDWGLNPGPPALEASTIPLGYRGGGIDLSDFDKTVRHYVAMFSTFMIFTSVSIESLTFKQLCMLG